MKRIRQTLDLDKNLRYRCSFNKQHLKRSSLYFCNAMRTSMSLKCALLVDLFTMHQGSIYRGFRRPQLSHGNIKKTKNIKVAVIILSIALSSTNALFYF